MKYVLIFLSLSACQFSSKNETPAVESRVSTMLESPADTIVPAKFDTEKHLVRLSKSDAEWKRSLSEMEYYVLREEGTERAFTGDLLKNHETGTYTCRGCGLPLRKSRKNCGNVASPGPRKMASACCAASSGSDVICSPPSATNAPFFR